MANSINIHLGPANMRTPGTVRHNRVVIALSIARMATAMGNGMLLVILPLYVMNLPIAVFHFPSTVFVGILISLHGFTLAAGQPFTGALSDLTGRRKPLILAGALLTAVSTLAFAVAHEPTSLLVIRFIQGLGMALSVPASLAALMEVTTRRTRGTSLGIYNTMTTAGFAIGPLAGGFLQTYFGFDAVFITGAVLVMMGIVPVQLWLDEPTVSNDNIDRRSFHAFDMTLLRGGSGYLTLALLIMATSSSMITSLENELNARLQQNVLGFSVALSGLEVSRLIFQYPIGKLSDITGRRPFIIIGLFLMAPATILLGFATTTTQLTWLRVFQGIGASAITASAFAMAGDFSKTGGEGRLMSIVSMGFALGLAVGPLLAGTLATYSFQLPFLIGGLMDLIGGCVVYHKLKESHVRSDVGQNLD